MSKEEAVLILEKAGYTAKIENSVVIAKIEKFSLDKNGEPVWREKWTKEEAQEYRDFEAGYNSSFGVKNWKEGEKNVPGEEKEI